jgi:Patatin-like phospholipase
VSQTYSPHLRTALLLSGSGTAGAYHAGVLRALHEAGVRLDVVSGCGVGVVGALLAAIDGGPRTWEQDGVWRRRPPILFYRWRRPLRLSFGFVLASMATLAIPLVVLSTGIVVYPLSFLIQMIDPDAGQRLATGYASAIARAFAPGGLPLLIPRLVTLILVSALLVLVIAAVAPKTTRRRWSEHGRSPSVWWARLIGPPWSADPGIQHVERTLWRLIGGPGHAGKPASAELSRRYLDLLVENFGQPGFRELIVTAVDLDMRGDLVFAALQEQRRQAFFHRAVPAGRGSSAQARVEASRSGDLIDLIGVGRTHVTDVLSAALTIPMLTDPHLITFSPESYWKGEVHRLGDRSGLSRLLQELAAAGVEQVIVVSSVAERATPHRLDRPLDSLASRASEYLSAGEAAAVRQAVAAHRKDFRSLFLIRPVHNPVGPLDFGGARDERSDRFQTVQELIDRGYEDAYRQFIDPGLGAE